MIWWKSLKLSKREKLYLFGGGICIAAVLIFHCVLSPFFDARAQTRRSIEARERDMRELTALKAEYVSLKDVGAKIGGLVAKRPGNFTLFSFLEQQAGTAGVKETIEYMKPSTINDRGPYKISSIEMKLEKITLKQLVAYLRLAESPAYLVRIKRMSIKQSKAHPGHLTALIQFVTRSAMTT